MHNPPASATHSAEGPSETALAHRFDTEGSVAFGLRMRVLVSVSDPAGFLT